MAAPKFLLDNDLPASLRGVLENKGYRAEFCRDHLRENAEDIEILLWAHERNWYLVTHDKGFRENVDTHPCKGPYARRTVLRLPTYLLGQADKYLITAWKAVTWSRVRAQDAIEVHETVVIAFECAGRAYREVQRWNIKV